MRRAAAQPARRVSGMRRPARADPESHQRTRALDAVSRSCALERTTPLIRPLANPPPASLRVVAPCRRVRTVLVELAVVGVGHVIVAVVVDREAVELADPG